MNILFDRNLLLQMCDTFVEEKYFNILLSVIRYESKKIHRILFIYEHVPALAPEQLETLIFNGNSLLSCKDLWDIADSNHQIWLLKQMLSPHLFEKSLVSTKRVLTQLQKKQIGK